MTYLVKKNHWFGAILVVIFGPFGFLYYSWKKAAVSLFLFFLPNILLYNIDTTIAEVTRWAIQLLMASFAYLDLKGKLDLFEDFISKIISTISVPIFLLNFFGEIVGGIWLIILGQWKLVLGAFLFSMFVPWAFSIVTLIQMPMLALVLFLQKRNLKSFYIITSFINIFLGHFIIILYVFFVLGEALNISANTGLNIYAILLFGYGIATGPFSYMASREDPDSYASIFGVFIAQISYIIYALTFLINQTEIAFPIILLIIFGIEVFQLYMVSEFYNIDAEDKQSFHIDEKPDDLQYPNDSDIISRDDPQELLDEAISLIKKKLFQQALDTLAKVISINSSIKEAYYYRALVNKELGEKSLVWDDIKIAAELGHKKSIEIINKQKLKKNEPRNFKELSPTEKYSILILDDEEDLTYSLVKSIKNRNKQLKIISYNNGDDALKGIETYYQTLKIVITDINHPGIDGISLLKTVKESYPNIEVIIQSAYLSESTIQTCSKYTNHILPKPYEFEELFNLTYKLINANDNVNLKKKILIIDDEFDTRDLLQDYLTHDPYYKNTEILLSRDGVHALELIEKLKGNINIIISDINHPGPNGLEILKIVKTKYPNIIFFIQSGNLTDSNLSESKNLGDSVLGKPIILKELNQLLKKYI